MALDPVVNFFRSEIATLPVTAGAVTIVLASGDGAKLPNPAVDGAFNLTIYNEADQFTAPEIVRVTARSSDTLTVTRAQEGTTGTTKTAGAVWTVVLTPTAKMITDIDSAKLDVAGGTMTGDLTIPDKIIHAGDTDTAIRFPANDTVAVETGGVEALRVDSSQRVGIGTTNPLNLLTVGNNGGQTNALIAVRSRGTINPNSIEFGHPNINGFLCTLGANVNNGRPFIAFNAEGGTNDNTYRTRGIVGRVLTADLTGGLLFSRVAESNADNQTLSNDMIITSAGNVGIGTTTPATKLDVVGSIRSSTGILFGTDTAAANTLDDYEEGTWTPVFTFATAGNLAVGYNVEVSTAFYTKIGRVVTLTFMIRADTFTHTTASGSFQLTGLPFTAINYAQQGFGATGSSDVLMGFSGTTDTVKLSANKNTTLGTFFKNDLSDVLTVADVTTGNPVDLRTTLTYISA